MSWDPFLPIQGVFPPVAYAFAYGSGVFHQPGLYSRDRAGLDNGVREDSAGPMLDYIFAVDDPTEWHAENIARNRAHYSGLASLGPSTVALAADRIGAGVYFHPKVAAGGRLVKYGVMARSRLERDLMEWTDLYVAGRLHKPVRQLVPGPHSAAERLGGLQGRNREYALMYALLQAPAQFTLADILHAIVAISYSGDVRMGLAEDPRKIGRIVEGSRAELEAIYLPRLEQLFHREPSLGGRTRPQGSLPFSIDQSPQSTAVLASRLAPSLQSRMLGRSIPDQGSAAAGASASVVVPDPSRRVDRDPNPDVDGPPSSSNAAGVDREAWVDFIRQHGSGAVGSAARLHCARLVWRSSARQAVLGLLSTSPWKSIAYVMDKVKKRLK